MCVLWQQASLGEAAAKRGEHEHHQIIQEQQQQQSHGDRSMALHITRPTNLMSTFVSPPPIQQTSIVLDDPYHVSVLQADKYQVLLHDKFIFHFVLTVTQCDFTFSRAVEWKMENSPYIRNWTRVVFSRKQKFESSILSLWVNHPILTTQCFVQTTDDQQYIIHLLQENNIFFYVFLCSDLDLIVYWLDEQRKF